MALTPFKSNLIADVGISMGDEGKGRLIPEIVRELQALTGRRDVVGTVLKVNGGANSGHTVAGLKLNLLPGGVAEHDVACLALGSGVVADPRKALWEALPLEKIGIPVLSRLLIDERCMISDVSHRILDLAWEDYRINVLGHEARGSTGRGITPAYADEVGQFQIHYSEFLGAKSDYATRLSARLNRAASIVRGSSIIGTDDLVVAAIGSGNKITWARAGLSKMPNLRLSAMGGVWDSEMEFTCLGDSGVEQTNAAYWQTIAATTANVQALWRGQVPPLLCNPAALALWPQRRGPA